MPTQKSANETYIAQSVNHTGMTATRFVGLEQINLICHYRQANTPSRLKTLEETIVM